jgi:hypothetical protein
MRNLEFLSIPFSFELFKSKTVFIPPPGRQTYAQGRGVLIWIHTGEGSILRGGTFCKRGGRAVFFCFRLNHRMPFF